MWPDNLTDEELRQEAARLSVAGLALVLKGVTTHEAQEAHCGAYPPAQSDYWYSSVPCGIMGGEEPSHPRGVSQSVKRQERVCLPTEGVR